MNKLSSFGSVLEVIANRLFHVVIVGLAFWFALENQITPMAFLMLFAIYLKMWEVKDV